MNNDAPFVSGEKLWTVEEIKINGSGYCGERTGWIVSAKGNKMHVVPLGFDQCNSIVANHNASHLSSLPQQEEREKLLEVLRDARATFMNLGIDNDTPMGLQLRKAAGRISKVLENETPVVSKAEDGQTQTALSVVLDEIEQRANAAPITEELGSDGIRRFVAWDKIGRAYEMWIKTSQADVPALVKALRMTLEYVYTSDPRWADVEREITTLLTSPAETPPARPATIEPSEKELLRVASDCSLRAGIGLGMARAQKAREFLIEIVNHAVSISWNFDEQQRDPIHASWKEHATEALKELSTELEPSDTERLTALRKVAERCVDGLHHELKGIRMSFHRENSLWMLIENELYAAMKGAK